MGKPPVLGAMAFNSVNDRRHFDKRLATYSFTERRKKGDITLHGNC